MAFSMIDVKAMERDCYALVSEIFDEVAQPQIDAYIDLLADEMRGK